MHDDIFVHDLKILDGGSGRVLVTQLDPLMVAEEGNEPFECEPDRLTNPSIDELRMAFRLLMAVHFYDGKS